MYPNRARRALGEYRGLGFPKSLRVRGDWSRRRALWLNIGMIVGVSQAVTNLSFAWVLIPGSIYVGWVGRTTMHA